MDKSFKRGGKMKTTDRIIPGKSEEEMLFGKDLNSDYGFEDVSYGEMTGFGRPDNKYEGINAYSDEGVRKYCGPLVTDTVKGVSFDDLLEKHGMMIKYSDERYSELFSALKKGIEENCEIDEDIFNDIFFGKISAIVKNCYNSFRCSFACEHIGDIFNEAYMLIYKKTIHRFFYNPASDLPKDEISYLKWCKTCITNSIRSKLRGKNKIDLAYLRFDGFDGDDADKEEYIRNIPSGNPTPEQIVIERAMINEMFSYVASLNSKPEKKLMWFAIQLCILNGSASDKIAANHMVYDECSEMTLAEFAKYVMTLSYGIEWLELKANDIEELCEGITEKSVENARIKALVSGENGDEGAFLKKISDWAFKINSSLNQLRGAAH